MTGHGKTAQLNMEALRVRFRRVKPREARERDRWLAGKARIRERRALRREQQDD